MPNQRRGYIGQDKRGQRFARATITAECGKRRKIPAALKINPKQGSILKTLLRRLDDEGCKAVDYARLKLGDWADFCAALDLKSAGHIDGRKAPAMKVHQCVGEH